MEKMTFDQKHFSVHFENNLVEKFWGYIFLFFDEKKPFKQIAFIWNGNLL